MIIYRMLVVGLVENTFLFILHNIGFGFFYIHRLQPHGFPSGIEIFYVLNGFIFTSTIHLASIPLRESLSD